MTTPQHDDHAARHEAFSRTLVELADTLVHEFDVVSFLQLLSSRCVELFDLTSAGVMLHDSDDTLHVMASSDEEAHALEVLELQNQEGPCLDAYRLGNVVQADASSTSARWPLFAPHAQARGYLAVSAVPMRLRLDVIGALNLFRDRDEVLSDSEVRDAQALADIATISLLQERVLRESRLVAEQLQQALTSRVVLEQAKGVLAVKIGCDVDQAFLLLRSYARTRNLRLSDVARQVVEGVLTSEALGPG